MCLEVKSKIIFDFTQGIKIENIKLISEDEVLQITNRYKNIEVDKENWVMWREMM